MRKLIVEIISRQLDKTAWKALKENQIILDRKEGIIKLQIETISEFISDTARLKKIISRMAEDLAIQAIEIDLLENKKNAV